MSKKLFTSDQKAFEKAFTYLSCALLLLSPLLELITALLVRLNSSVFEPGILQPYLTGAFGIAGTVLAAVYLVYGIKNKSFRFSLSEYFYVSLVFFSLLSQICTRRYFGSINHPWWYREGFQDFLAYYCLFYFGTKIRSLSNRVKILDTFVIAAVLNGIIAFLQSIGINISYCLLPPPMFEGINYSYGFTYNPNYYGGLSAVLLALTCGLFIFSKSFTRSRSFSILTLCLSCLIFYTTLTSRARLAWVGDLCAIAFFTVSLIVTRRTEMLKRLGILIAALFAVFALTYFLTDFIVFNVERTSSEVSGGDISYDLGSQRLYLWRFAIESVPHNWLTGVGLDNFDAVFFDNPRWNETMYYKGHCHNEYLHTLATQGVPAFVNQMALFLTAVIWPVKAIKRSPDNKENIVLWIFLGMLVTYLGKALFDSSVINTSIYIWPLIGLCLGSKEEIKGDCIS